MPPLALAATLAFLPAAHATPPAAKPAPQATHVGASVDATSASHCARAGELMGANCSYTTGMMARRVLEEGQDWSFDGALQATSNSLDSLVAAPFTADGTNVIANELVELISHDGHTRARLSLVGKLLEVDGVRYVVLTSFRVLHS